jgi:hypothetical protein
MSTPAVTANIIALVPVTRDDFADEPAPAHTDAHRRPARGPVRGSI